MAAVCRSDHHSSYRFPVCWGGKRPTEPFDRSWDSSLLPLWFRVSHLYLFFSDECEMFLMNVWRSKWLTNDDGVVKCSFTYLKGTQFGCYDAGGVGGFSAPQQSTLNNMFPFSTSSFFNDFKLLFLKELLIILWSFHCYMCLLFFFVCVKS